MDICTCISVGYSIYFGYMKILLSIPDNLVKIIDEECVDEEYERSEYIRMCIRQHVFGDAKFTGTDGTPISTPAESKDLPKFKWKESPSHPLDDGVDLEIESTVPPETKTIQGWCQLHFEKGKNYPLRKVTWEDENGTEVIKDKFACPKCIQGLEGKDGHLYLV